MLLLQEKHKNAITDLSHDQELGDSPSEILKNQRPCQIPGLWRFTALGGAGACEQGKTHWGSSMSPVG